MPAPALQLPLPDVARPEPAPENIAARTKTVRAVFSASTKRIGPKSVARVAGRKGDHAEKTLSAAAEERDGNKLGPADLVTNLVLDERHELIRELCALAGGTFVPFDQMTDEIRLERWREGSREILSDAALADVEFAAAGDVSRWRLALAKYLSARAISELAEYVEGRP